MKSQKPFPKDFLWGASTASHQVEGGTRNQWTEWENSNAERFASRAKQRLSWLPIWDEIEKQATDPQNYISGKGVDHYNRYKEDFEIVKSLNLNAFRFSIEWSRVEPEEGQWDEKEIARYLDYIKTLNKMGIKPMLNIWHWTNPIWFEEKGAFAKRKNVDYFLRFVEKIAPIIKESEYVITINEPNNVVWFQYISGAWPPGEKSKYLKAFLVFRNMVQAHKKSYKFIKSIHPESIVTSTISGSSNQPLDPKKWLHRTSASLMNYYGNTWYLYRVKKYQDIIGFNFYFKNYVKGPRPEIDFQNPKKPLNDLGWYMEPYSLLELMRLLHKKFPKTPIMILENGVADRNDKYRKWWIKETIRAMEDALSEGIPLKGYMHWSLLDNFEWSDGWWPEFGLVHVDRKTMKRTVRPSAKYLADRITDLTES